MIPISALLTPYEAPPLAPVGLAGRSLGDLGEFLQGRKEHEAAAAAQAQRDTANQGIQNRQLDETTRYHDLLYKEHGERATDKRNAAKDKIREHLFDRLHKVTPDDKLSVIQEFKRLGDTVEESASAYQAPAGPVDEGKAANTAPAKVQRAQTGQAPQDKETTQLSPQEEQAFQAWAVKHGIRDVDHPDAHYDYRGAFKDGLEPGPDHHWPDTYKQHGHESFSEESRYSAGPGDGGTWKGNKLVQPKSKRIEPPEFAGYSDLAGAAKGGSLGASSYASMPDSEGNQAPPPPAGTAPPTPAKRAMPPEIAALVPEGATAAKPSAPEPLKSGGGKFTVRNSEGDIIHEYDAPAEKQKQLSAISTMGMTLVKNAGFPEDETAAKGAAEYASSLVGVIPEEKIPDAFLKAYQEKLSGYKKKHIAGQEGAGGPAGPSKTDIKLQGMDNETANKIRDDVSRDFKFPAAVTSAKDAQKGLKLMTDLDSGFGDAAAFGSFLNDLSGKVVTDRERSFYMGSEGIWTELSAKVAKYTNGGRLPTELTNEIRKRFETTIALANQNRQEAAAQARATAEHTPGAEGSADMLDGYFSGKWKPPPPSNRLSGKKPGGGAPAPASPAAPGKQPQTLDEWRAAQKAGK